ncbi:hypothetical protein A2W32_00775 [candidate division WWE3 bacterium RBG_16_37_10]|uniref:Ribosomal RNA adenine methylase transferase N-terminal domain-containing protein n=1 Tax=candidate division WWE3 bacterium RBG_16_37_10 TaxID=1802610 RepID=A0A1F4UX38_UNCKA|nr:MAG: hypothetical protein A2W32_00775 [candidate division WWE3 bacterium RBG_16_37_10]
MWREGRFVSFSQNFINNPNLIKRLIKQSDISISDIVIEIGAGKGVITKQLCKTCKHVIAIEIDSNLYNQLLNNLKIGNITLINNNILRVNLPKTGYKVFSNIPFNYTSRIMNKLYFQGNPPQSAYLIMQREAGNIYIGYPRETQKSLLLKPFFRIEVFHRFNKTIFRPTPSIDANMLQIKVVKNPILEKGSMLEYFDFVVYGTTQYKNTLKKSLSKIFTHEQFKRLSKDLEFSVEAKPLDLTYIQWVKLYKYYKYAVIDKKKMIVNGSYHKQELLQKHLKKSFRTRNPKILRNSQKT